MTVIDAVVPSLLLVIAASAIHRRKVMKTRTRQARKEDGGFTLVELIVVVVVIGVLAAIAVPVYVSRTAKANVTADLATLSIAKVALANYTADRGSAASSDPTTDELAPYGFPTSPVMTVKWVVGPKGYFVILMETASGTITSRSGKSCSVWVNEANDTLACSP